MSQPDQDDFLSEQLAWLRAGKSLYLEWESRRGFFYGNVYPRVYVGGMQFRLVAKQQCWLLPKIRDGVIGSRQKRDIRETFHDNRSLTAFLRCNRLDPRIWRCLAQLRDGQGLSFRWGSYEQWNEDMGSGSMRLQGKEVIFRGENNTSPGDCMNPAQDFCRSYRVGDLDEDRSLAVELGRLLWTPRS